MADAPSCRRSPSGFSYAVSQPTRSRLYQLQPLVEPQPSQM